MNSKQEETSFGTWNQHGEIRLTSVAEEKKRATFKFGLWNQPVQITPNNFIYKSLSDFAVNLAIGCSHGCLFCYVPDASTIKQGPALKRFGVDDPDGEWGKYAFLRPWDEDVFMKSLLRAQLTPASELSKDGHREVIFCTTTDAYQVFKGHPDKKRLNEHEKMIRRRSVTLIRDYSDLNTRVLTRSALARYDFDLYVTFGNRLSFGMSIPTLKEELVEFYEPGASSVKQRLETLRLAKEAGIPIFVAIAPTYAECDADDLEATLIAIAELDPVCIYHEPINIRAENVKRIEENAKALGISLNTKVFDTPRTWRRYAIDQLFTVQRLAEKLGLIDRLKLWPDADLKTKSHFMTILKEDGQLDVAANELAYMHHVQWLEGWWTKVAAWPGAAPQADWTVPPIPMDSPFAGMLLQAPV
jgi:DNA repair photolyase